MAKATYWTATDTEARKRGAMMLFSTGLIAFGLFWYVPADIIPLAGEGAMLAISKTIKKPFPTVKIAFDVTMVVISLITCLVCLHSLGSVGIGTIVKFCRRGKLINAQELVMSLMV